MPQETMNLTESLELQANLFRELSAEILACEAACAAMNPEAIYRHAASQETICERLQQLRRNMVRPAPDEIPNAGAENLNFSPQLKLAVAELAILQKDVRRLNEEHIVLVNGSRRSLSMMGNALAGFRATYDRPAANPSAGRSER